MADIPHGFVFLPLGDNGREGCFRLSEINGVYWGGDGTMILVGDVSFRCPMAPDALLKHLADEEGMLR